MNTNYLKLVEVTLQSRWQSTIPQENLKAGIPLFTKIAFEEATKELPPLSYAPAEESSDIAERIKQFISDHSLTFGKACLTGYSFTHRESEMALRHAMEHQTSIITSQLLSYPGYLSEEELNAKSNFHSCSGDAIPEACRELMTLYLNGDLKAGYYLLWLIKHDTRSNFQIPAKEGFTSGTVQWVLSRFIENQGAVGAPSRLIEIFFIKLSIKKGYLYEQLVAKAYHQNLIDYIVSVLPENDSLRKDVIQYLIYKTQSLTEEKLKGLAIAVIHLEVPVMQQIIWDLYRSSSNGKIGDGFMALWLMKYYSGSAFQLPPMDCCSSEKVHEVIRHYIESEPLLSLKLIEILFTQFNYKKDGENWQVGHLFECLLETPQQNKFLETTIEQLKTVPTEEWEMKAIIILLLLQVVTDESKSEIAKQLSESTDSKTNAIGRHLTAGLQAKSPGDSAFHFDALLTLLNCSHASIEKIFGKRFVNICFPSSNFPQVRYLHFNYEVFVQEDIAIGVHGGVYIGDKGPYLIACDLKKEKMKWCIPLSHSIDKLQFFGNQVAFHQRDSKQIDLIDMETGLPSGSFPVKNHFRPMVYITPDGVVFQRFDGVVVGKLSNGVLQPVAEYEKPPYLEGMFFSEYKQFSSHFLSLYFSCKSEAKLLELVSPSGHHKTISGCIDVFGYENKIVLIEEEGGKLRASIRTLSDDPAVISEPETLIPFDARKIEDGKMCGNGLLIVYEKTNSGLIPTFIDLKEKTAIRSPHPIGEFAKKAINHATGDIYICNDPFKKNKLFKITPSGEMQVVDMEESGTLVHASNNLLYFNWKS